MMNREDYKLGEKYILSDTFVISKICVDVDFIKYIDLGRVLSNNGLNENMFNQIIKIITNDDFKKRQTNDLRFILQSIPNINKYLESNHSDDVIFRIAPSFDQSEELVNNQQRVSDRYKEYFGITKPNTISINIASIPNISQDLKDHLRNEYEFIFGSKVDFINFQTMTNEEIISYDAFYVGNFQRFNAKCIDMLDASLMIDKFIFCERSLPLLEMNIDPYDTEKIDGVFHNIELLMVAASKFHFVPPFQCLTRRINEHGNNN